ncbi:unnamed protein product [Mortierella alpina]
MQSSEDQFTHRPMDQDTSTPLSPTDRHPITDNDSTVPTENSDHEFDNKRTNDIDSRSRESQPSTKSLSETTDEESSTPASTVASSSGTTSGSTPDIVASTAASHDRHVKRKESKEQYDMMKAREDAKIAQLKATIVELERQEQELLHSIRCSLCKFVAPLSPLVPPPIMITCFVSMT